MRACIIFASTSGSTRVVAGLLSKVVDPADMADLIDLKDWDRHGKGFDSSSYDLVVLGTPTYGTGDWHYLWARHADSVFGRLFTGQPVALFGLGDQRGHGHTFAGGLGRLYAAGDARGLKSLGHTAPDRFCFQHSPALIGQRFPGLVLNYKREHRAAPALVGEWFTMVRREYAEWVGRQAERTVRKLSASIDLSLCAARR